MNIVITGASRGIGASIAEALAGPDRTLWLLARTESALEEVAEQVRERGAEARIRITDLSSMESARQAAEDVLAEGRIDVLILNAGASNAAPFLESGLEDIERELRINYLAPLAFLKTCLPAMQAQEGGGHVICVASLAALTPFPGEATYAASKAALLHLLRSLQIELADSPVSLTAVLPGFTRTAMTEQHRSLLPAMEPAQVAAEVASALEGRPALVIPGWDNRLAARLFRTFPGWSDQLLSSLGRSLIPTPS